MPLWGTINHERRDLSEELEQIFCRGERETAVGDGGGRTRAGQPCPYPWRIAPVRKPLRHPDYYYATAGYYFITICTHHRISWFGHVGDSIMHLYNAGCIAQKIWLDLPERFASLQLDLYVVMPNHFHGILVLGDKFAYGPDQLHGKLALSEIVRTYKSVVSCDIRATVNRDFAWQKSYYDIVVRDEKMLHNLRQYIINNPARWQQDKLYRD